MSDLEFAILICLFTAYYFIERCLRTILFAYHPSFYEKICSSRKDLVFFGILMGLLITVFSTPFCLHGALTTWTLLGNSSDLQSAEWSLDPYAKICVASRAILWVSELNRLDMYGLYIVHHAGSILSLVSFIYFKWPTLILFTLYSSLFSEIPGDLVWMLSSYLGSSRQAPPSLLRFRGHLVCFNAIQYFIIRGTGIVLVCWMLLINSPGLQGRSLLEQIYAYSLFGLYILFCVSYVIRQRASIIDKHRPSESAKITNALQTTSSPSRITSSLGNESPLIIKIHFANFPTIFIVPYGLLMGIGFAALVFTTITIGAPSKQDSDQLPFALNTCLVSAVVFARLMSVVMEEGVASLFTAPFDSLLRPGFWLHGGLLGAALGALLSYKLGYVRNFSMFAGGLAVGLPLYETFSRIGCHTYGCCYGRVVRPSSTVPADRFTLWSIFPFPAVKYSHPNHYAATRINPGLLNEPLIPIQLISATLFLLLFLCVALPLSYYTRVEIAGSMTLICHAIVRLLTEQLRGDYRGGKYHGLSITGRITMVQATGAVLWLAYAVLLTESPVPDHGHDTLAGRLWNSLFAVIMGIVVYGVHIGEIGSWTGAKGKNMHTTAGRDVGSDTQNTSLGEL